MRLAVIAVALAAVPGAGACGATPSTLSAVPGNDRDEGHGELAKASTKFMTSEQEDDDLFVSSGRRPVRRDPDEYGGSPYGGSSYGGAGYTGFVVPNWSYPSVNRTPKYNQVTGLSGAIEGVISWRGAVPAKRSSPCGPIEVMRVASDRGISDVLVFIEHVEIGRTLPNEGRPATVGGVVVKHGCALVPTVQVLTPLPAALSIHGDAKRSKLVVTNAPAPPRPLELQEGGRASIQVQQGTTRIDAEDGSLASAWVLALDTPYYAVTDDRGQFRLDELSPGTYDVTIWQAPIPEDGSGAIKYGAPTVVHRIVRVDSGKSARLDVSLGR